MLVKEQYVSRSPEGLILNGDLVGIEFVLLAQLSKDQNLINLINSGQDVHKYMYNRVYGTPLAEITKAMRSGIKAIDFGINYGKAAASLAQTTGLSEEECQNIIDEFYKAFPNVKLWQDMNIEKVRRDGYLKTPVGSILRFNKYVYIQHKKTLYKPEIHDRMRLKADYAKTDIKNYPVQHMAGVVMFLILGRFFREHAIYNRDKYLLINTVHDSLMCDCSSAINTDYCQSDISKVIDKLPEYMLNLFNIKLLCKIQMDFSRGKSWLDLK